MKQGIYTILSNEKTARDTYILRLNGDSSAITAPGQFINIRLDGLFLRRPISVHEYDENGVTVIYKVVGEGTRALSRLSGGSLDVLTGLGNGFNLSRCGLHPLLLGGGVGAAPMYGLLKAILSEKPGAQVSVILGFNTADEVFGADKMRALGARVYICTLDGSLGEKGYVTDVMDRIEYDSFFACGPMPMLRAVSKAVKCPGQYSFEERMGCGFGACMGCTCKTLYGDKRICRDGPVLDSEEVIW